MSAPTPSTRWALSFTIPWHRPTTRMTIPTSMATASTLTAVRMGRCRTFEMISLLTKWGFPLLCRAQVHQFRALRHFQVEFLRRDRIIERGLFNGYGNRVIFLRPTQFDVGWIVNTLKILVDGVVDVFGASAIRLIELNPHQFQVFAVKPHFAPQDHVPVPLRLNNGYHVKALGLRVAVDLFPIACLMFRINGGNNQRL